MLNDRNQRQNIQMDVKWPKKDAIPWENDTKTPENYAMSYKGQIP